MNKLIRKLQSNMKLFWVRIFFIQLILLGVIGIWAISGTDVEIYQTNNPDEIQNIELPMGTYRAYITYSSTCEDNAGTFISASNNPWFKADTLQFYSWENVDYLQLWALKNIPDVKFVYHRSDGDLHIEHVSIAETKDYKRMIWTVVLFVMLLIDLSLIWWKKIRTDYSNDKREKYHAVARTIILIVVGIIACYPLYISWLIPAHDITFHLSRIEGIKEGLLPGQFPVRIQPTWFEGAGYAVSVMYGDALLYIPAILRIMGFSLQASLKIYMVLVTAGTIGCTYYALLKLRTCGREMRKWVAVLATVVYTLSLYRIGDVYIRQALGEYTAMMFYPLVFCGFYRIFYGDETDGNKRWFMPAIGMTGILTCHSISSVIVAFVLAIWCILECNRILKRDVLLQILKTVCATVLLSAAFLVPFLDYLLFGSMNISNKVGNEVSFIQQEGLKIEELLGINYHGTDCRVYGAIYFVIAIALLLLLIFSIFQKKQDRKEFLSKIKIFAMFVLTTWMATVWFPWDALSEASTVFSAITSTIQFPFRFAGIAMLFLTLFIAQALNETVEKKMIMTVICIFSFELIVVSAVRYESNILEHNNRYRVYDAAGLGLHTCYGIYSTFIVCGGEYIPQEVFDLGEYRYEQPDCEADVTWQEMERKGASLCIAVENGSTIEKDFSVPLMYYKGYQAKSMEDGTSLDVFSGNNGMATVSLSAGYKGRIRFEFASPWYWHLAEIITLLTGIYLLLVMFRSDKQNSYE